MITSLQQVLKAEIERAKYLLDRLSESGEPISKDDAEFLRTFLLSSARSTLYEFAFSGDRGSAEFLHTYLDL